MRCRTVLDRAQVVSLFHTAMGSGMGATFELHETYVTGNVLVQVNSELGSQRILLHSGGGSEPLYDRPERALQEGNSLPEPPA